LKEKAKRWHPIPNWDQIKLIYTSSENEIPSDKYGKMTAGPIKTLGFQDRLSGIALSFGFVNFGYYN
jgi:hypothetical protein